MSICCLRCRRRRPPPTSRDRRNVVKRKIVKMGQKHSVTSFANKDVILSKAFLPSKESSISQWRDQHGSPDLVLIVGKTRFPVHKRILIDHSAYFRFDFFLSPGPIDYAEHVSQGLQEVYSGWNNQYNIYLVFCCLAGCELTTLGHESSALSPRQWLLAC